MERDYSDHIFLSCFDISTHTLTWSVTTVEEVKKLIKEISTHTLTWSVTGCPKALSYDTYFNSHAHVERDGNEAKDTSDKVNFNSHAHVERDYRIVNSYLGIDISTHTLTWSVTGRS